MNDYNINTEVQLDLTEWMNVGDFVDLMNRLSIQRDWSFNIEHDTCTTVRFHKNDEIE